MRFAMSPKRPPGSRVIFRDVRVDAVSELFELGEVIRPERFANSVASFKPMPKIHEPATLRTKRFPVTLQPWSTLPTSRT